MQRFPLKAAPNWFHSVPLTFTGIPTYATNSKDAGGNVVAGAHALRAALHSITTIFRQPGPKAGTDNLEGEG